jgi:hypothetical protein
MPQQGGFAMSSLQSHLEGLNNWLDRQNARDDAISKARPAWWHGAKIVFGASCLARGVNMGIHADSVGNYALAVLLVAAALALMADGVSILREKRLAAKAAR